MKKSNCDIKRAVIISMLSWVEGNSTSDELKVAVQVYLDIRCGDPTTETNASDRQRCILTRWAVACGVMAPILQKIPSDKVRPLFNAVHDAAYEIWDS